MAGLLGGSSAHATVAAILRANLSSKLIIQASAKFASEAIEHIRTVLALGQVYNFLDQFVLVGWLLVQQRLGGSVSAIHPAHDT